MSKYILGVAALALVAAAAAVPGTARAQGVRMCSGPPANGIHFSYVENDRESALWRPVCSVMVTQPSRQAMQDTGQPGDDLRGRT